MQRKDARSLGRASQFVAHRGSVTSCSKCPQKLQLVLKPLSRFSKSFEAFMESECMQKEGGLRWFRRYLCLLCCDMGRPMVIYPVYSLHAVGFKLLTAFVI